MARKYSNVSRPMNLVVACNNTDTVITVNDASGLPVTFPYALAVDYEGSAVEIMLVTAAAGNTLTVSRGQEDTAAQAHSTGAVVVHAATALDFAASAIHAEATQNVHGIGAGNSVVGTATAQTLTNKTIDGATFTAPAIFQGNTYYNQDAEFRENVTIIQPPAGAGLVVTNLNNGPSTSDVVTVSSQQNQIGLLSRRLNATTTGGALLEVQDNAAATLFKVARDGATTVGPAGAGTLATGTLTATSTVKASNVLLAGSPDRDVKAELDVLLRPPRVNATRQTAQAITASTVTVIQFVNVNQNVGGWVHNAPTGEFTPPRYGQFLVNFKIWWSSTIVDATPRAINLYMRTDGTTGDTANEIWPRQGQQNGVEMASRQLTAITPQKFQCMVWHTLVGFSVTHAEVDIIWLSN